MSLFTKEDLWNLIHAQGVAAFNAYRQETAFDPIDLSRLDFTGMDLGGINLSQANLQASFFDFCVLDGATLIFSDFRRASLREARLGMVIAAEADFTQADLSQAQFSGADLTQAVFCGCDAKEAGFQEADLSGAQFQKAYLNDAVLTGADLRGTDFTDAEMEWAILTGVRFSETTRWSNQLPPGFQPLLSS